MEINKKTKEGLEFLDDTIYQFKNKLIMKQDESEELKNMIFQELGTFKDQQKKDGKAIAKTQEIVEDFSDKLTSMKAVPLSTDLAPVKELLEEQYLKTQTMIASIPRAIKRQYHFHFFPKINIKEYYQTYSKLMVYAILLLVVAGIVNIGWEWIKGYNERQDNLEQIEALKRYEENEYQLEMKRSKSKAAASSQNPEMRKERLANDKIVLTKKKEMDSIRGDFKKKNFAIVKDTLHK